MLDRGPIVGDRALTPGPLAAVTTKKKSTLILNVDGAIGCAFVDLLRSCGAFSEEEVRPWEAGLAAQCGPARLLPRVLAWLICC